MVFVTLKETATCCNQECLAPLSVGEDIFVDADLMGNARYSYVPVTIFFCNTECAEKYWDKGGLHGRLDGTQP
jgi:hypothetical protein